MGDAPAAITAQLVDVRNVAAHKSVRLELHVPAEQAGLVMAAFGWPTMADPVPVALARLQAAPEPIAKPEAPKERKAFADMPYAQQIGIRCGEGEFQYFIKKKHSRLYGPGPFASNSDAAAQAVRNYCAVHSRSEIAESNQAGGRWRALEAEYWAWQRGAR